MTYALPSTNGNISTQVASILPEKSWEYIMLPIMNIENGGLINTRYSMVVIGT